MRIPIAIQQELNKISFHKLKTYDYAQGALMYIDQIQDVEPPFANDKKYSGVSQEWPGEIKEIVEFIDWSAVNDRQLFKIARLTKELRKYYEELYNPVMEHAE